MSGRGKDFSIRKKTLNRSEIIKTIFEGLLLFAMVSILTAGFILVASGMQWAMAAGIIIWISGVTFYLKLQVWHEDRE